MALDQEKPHEARPYCPQSWPAGGLGARFHVAAEERGGGGASATQLEPWDGYCCAPPACRGHPWLALRGGLMTSS
jgi:hypothetical protein